MPRRRARPGGASPDPGQFWKDFIRDTAPEFRKPTIDQLATFMQPTWQALIDGASYCEPHLREIIARQRPDVIVEDNVVSFPALQTAGKPFVRIVSCHPLEIRGAIPTAPAIPPTYSGLPTDDPSDWEAFREEYDRTHRHLGGLRRLVPGERDRAPSGARVHPHLPRPEPLHLSAGRRLRRSPAARPRWVRLDSTVRATDAPFELPAALADRPAGSALIYLSLGSLGSADRELMRRLVSVLADTPHRYVVSKGPQHALYDLAPNMWGSEFLPQTSIVPLVDLVITHGGNNTTTEAFHFGKPMVVLPLFWDQYDNAQRVDETGFGVRLPTYAFADADLAAAIDRLLGDVMLRTRMAGLGAEIRARDGVARAAAAIEAVGLAAR